MPKRKTAIPKMTRPHAIDYDFVRNKSYQIIEPKRRCRSCMELLPITEFYPREGGSRERSCRKCKYIKSAKKRTTTATKKICQGCNQELDITSFYQRSNGLSEPNCKDCRKTQAMNYKIRREQEELDGVTTVTKIRSYDSDKVIKIKEQAQEELKKNNIRILDYQKELKKAEELNKAIIEEVEHKIKQQIFIELRHLGEG